MATAFLQQVGVKSSEAILGEKIITENGTYSAENDELDGYSQVEVNVNTEAAFNAGKQAENLAFWNGFTNNRAKTDYSWAFYMWNPELLKFPYDVGGTNMSRVCYMLGEGDLREVLNKCDGKLDFSNATTVTYAFGSSDIIGIPTLDLSKATTLDSVFNNSKKLKYIDKIILSTSGTQAFTSNAFNCPALEEVRFEGVIGQNGFKVGDCPLLSHDSLMSIINSLEDKAVSTKISGSWKFNDSWVGDLNTSDSFATLYVEGEDSVFHVLEIDSPNGVVRAANYPYDFVELKGKTVDFGTEPQEIINKVAKWIIQNATSLGGTIIAEAGSVWTVTLGTTNLAKLTDAEKAIATQKGWTLA